jgi:CRISPR/Cas system-associated exonuclease Cas4 (RecB family)
MLRSKTLALPDDFQFSQASLQDFVQCRRRFQLRYLQQVSWPALETEPALENEQRMQRGARFHRMIRQHLLGIPPERLTSLAEGDPDLAGWWANYLTGAPAEIEGHIYPEVGLSSQIEGHRLVARYDLLVIQPEGGAVIFDWKTNQKHPKREWLAENLQTRVYPYLLVQAGAHLHEGRPFSPEQVEMVYWFAGYPDDPHRFPYSQDQYEADEEYLAALVKEIAGLGEDEFPLTEDLKRCQFCVYRSLCDRGVSAGALEDLEDALDFDPEADLDIDFDQIGEIEY